MIHSRLFKHTFIILVLIGIGDLIATNFYLYWTVWWVDMVMHFTGGLCVSMASIWLYSLFFNRFLSMREVVAAGLAGAFVVGLLWEIFELQFGITSLEDGMEFYTDTVSDIILDLSGGLLGGIYSFNLLKKS